MTAIGKEAMETMEKVPEDKLSSAIQVMQGVNGFLEAFGAKPEQKVDLDQFVMSETDRGREADAYIRELRDNDRL